VIFQKKGQQPLQPLPTYASLVTLARERFTAKESVRQP
jgi:hypothetical protein